MINDLQSGKLVRDRIPEIIRANGGNPTVRVLNEDDYVVALRSKLEEEVQELLEASLDHVPEEMADVLEVLKAMAIVYRIEWEVVIATEEEKRSERGGFEDKLWLG